MSEIERRVRDALVSLLDPVDPAPALPPPALRRARIRIAAIVTAVAATAAAVVTSAVVVVSQAPERGASRPATSPGGTGPYLFLSGKYADVWRVSADGVVVHRRVPQLDPGDPPHHLLARGGELLGWGYETYLLDPELQREAQVLVEDSLFFLPSAHEDRVWVTTEEPGTNRRIGTVREVALDGEVTVDDVPPPGGVWPAGAVDTGLLLRLDGELVVWDPRTREVVFRFPRMGDLGASHDHQVAWCDFGCAELHLTDVTTGDEETVVAPEGFRGFHAWDGAFSPDGATFAVPVVPAETKDRVQLALVDLATNETYVVAGAETGDAFNFVEWSRDGSHVFFTGGEAAGPREIFVYDNGAAAARRLDVSIGDFFDAAAI